MRKLRSERFAAGALLVAAALALVLANSPIGESLSTVQNSHFGIPAIGLDLSVGHWISDGLLAIFFFLIAIELRRELTSGHLNSVAKASVPAIAALGGVVAPALVYLAIAGSDLAGGWPIPTATDIAFAIGVLAVFGRALPGRVRIFLLALAVLDDLVAILIIAVFFTDSVNFGALALGVVAVILFGLISRLTRLPRRVSVPVLVLVALVAWYFVYSSGVHATIAGVLLGLAFAPKPAHQAAHRIEPFSNAIVLPLFAFSAALVTIPAVSISDLSPAFWAILVALPVGKLIGISIAGGVASRFGQDRSAALTFREVVVVAALGGIGFTVSLLMNELAFASSETIADEGTLAVLLGSAASIAISAVLVSSLSRRYRRQKSLTADPRPT